MNMENQGKSDKQIEDSYKAIFGALIGLIACLLFSLVSCVAVEVWNWMCG
jgi:hypothetical protein